MFPPEIQKIISSYLILGFLPLDKFLHFMVGVIVTILLRLFKIRMSIVFSATLILALGKECIDFYVLNNTFWEQFLDIGVTLIYPLLLWGVIKIKSATET